nr:EOG090X0N7H [Macrothrix elegans]
MFTADRFRKLIQLGRLIPTYIGKRNQSSQLSSLIRENPFEEGKKCCILCKTNIKIDYKNPRILSQFLSPFTGKVYQQNITGLCKQQQALLEKEIKKSQAAGFLPVMLKKLEFLSDPKLFILLNNLRPSLL